MNFSDLYSLRLHEAVLARLMENPDAVLARARSNMQRWAERWQDMPWYKEWAPLLDGPVEQIAHVLRDTSERAIWLRSTSPFAGVLSDRERWDILRECRREAGRA